MNFDELIVFLEKRTQKPMPGAVAHNLMMPKLSNGAPIQIKHPSPPRESAVLILLYNKDGVPYFPLIQRPQYEGVHSGQIALPGGKQEPADRNLFETALREAEEEIGVMKSQVEVVGNLTPFYVAASNYNVLPVIGKMDHEPPFVPDLREVEEIIHPSVGDLIQADNKKEKEVIARGGVKLQSPYFDLFGKTVWGATAMMLSEFAVIMEEFANS